MALLESRPARAVALAVTALAIGGCSVEAGSQSRPTSPEAAAPTTGLTTRPTHTRERLGPPAPTLQQTAAPQVDVDCTLGTDQLRPTFFDYTCPPHGAVIQIDADPAQPPTERPDYAQGVFVYVVQPGEGARRTYGLTSEQLDGETARDGTFGLAAENAVSGNCTLEVRGRNLRPDPITIDSVKINCPTG